MPLVSAFVWSANTACFIHLESHVLVQLSCKGQCCQSLPACSSRKMFGAVGSRPQSASWSRRATDTGAAYTSSSPQGAMHASRPSSARPSSAHASSATGYSVPMPRSAALTPRSAGEPQALAHTTGSAQGLAHSKLAAALMAQHSDSVSRVLDDAQELQAQLRTASFFSSPAPYWAIQPAMQYRWVCKARQWVCTRASSALGCHQTVLQGTKEISDFRYCCNVVCA